MQLKFYQQQRVDWSYRGFLVPRLRTWECKIDFWRHFPMGSSLSHQHLNPINYAKAFIILLW